MKRFLIYIIVFFCIVASIDIVFGVICDYLNTHAKGGDTATHYEATEVQREPVLILGSSRANHHYDPKVFEDSLGLGVYNCGVDGNGILFQYGRLKMITERYSPNVIIYDAIPNFDIMPDDNAKYLNWLRRWHGKHDIDSLINDISKLEVVKLHSSLYKYNGNFIQMLSDNLHPLQEVSYNGYKPLQGNMKYNPKEDEQKVAEWQPVKLKYFKKMIELCKDNDIKLIVAYSPMFGAKSSLEYEKLTRLCSDNDITILDHYSDTIFTNHREYFEDAFHLNDNGAKAYSATVAHELKNLL